MSYMLHFTGPQRQIIGVDYDDEKISTANHCFSKNERISFIYQDILNFSFEKYNAIVISDVLHYLQPGDQRLILEKCIKSLEPNALLIIPAGVKCVPAGQEVSAWLL